MNIPGITQKPDIALAARDYVIVRSGGQKDLIGKLGTFGKPLPDKPFLLGVDGAALEPVYELESDYREQAGNVIPMHAVMPVFMLASIERLPVAAGALVVPLSSLSYEEVVHLLAAIDDTAALIKRMRAAQAGVALASAMPPGRSH